MDGLFEARRAGGLIYRKHDVYYQIVSQGRTIADIYTDDPAAAEAVCDALNVHFGRIPIEEPKGERGED